MPNDSSDLILLTDLPVMNNLSVSDINYQLTYSESYSGLLNGAPPIIIANFPYVTLLLAALILFSWINLHSSNILSI